MELATTDLCDQYDTEVRVLDPVFRSFGGASRFCGPAATLKVHEDNSLVREALLTPGDGRVLVVDGGGSLRCALVGDQLTAAAIQNGWAGILVYGCIRDSRPIGEMPIGIRALATHPRKSVKKGAGDRDIAVAFAGATIHPGEWVYADEDGIIVAPGRLHS